MHILVVAAGLDTRSGWGRYANAVLDELARQGIQVSICSEDTGNRSEPATRLLPLSSWRTPYRVLVNAMRVRRAARGLNIVHVFDGWPFSVYGLCAVLGTKRKLFVSGIATYSVLPDSLSLKRLLFRWAYSRTERILSVSAYTSSRMRTSGIPGDKIRVVPMGATPLPLVSGEARATHMQRYGIPDDAFPVVLSVGQLKYRKGQLDTLQAIERLRIKYPHILYIAAGRADVAYAGRIADLVSHQSLEKHFRHIKDADDGVISSLYARADVVALNARTDEKTQHFEGFGLSVLEGYQFGKPAIGSRDSGVGEAIRDGVTGLLTEQGDAEDIANKICLVMADYERFSEAARRMYQDFNWRKTVAEYVVEYTR